MKHFHARARAFAVFAIFASTIGIAWLAAGCGVKGPPLPPISATPSTPEEKSLGRQPTPIQPIPSPSGAAPSRASSPTNPQTGQ